MPLYREGIKAFWPSPYNNYIFATNRPNKQQATSSNVVVSFFDAHDFFAATLALKGFVWSTPLMPVTQQTSDSPANDSRIAPRTRGLKVPEESNRW